MAAIHTSAAAVARASNRAAPEAGYGTRGGRVPVPVEVEHYIVPGTGGHGRARADALLAVIGTFGCRVTVYGYDATRHDKFLIMTGTRPALDALQLLLPSLAARMEVAARAAVRDYRRKTRYAELRAGLTPPSRMRVAPFFRDYVRGYGQGAAEAVNTLRGSVVGSEGTALAAVVAADERRVAEKFSARFPGRQVLRKERGGHRLAFESGKNEGLAAGLGDDDYLAVHDLVFAML
jgi:hypothetical protein